MFHRSTLNAYFSLFGGAESLMRAEHPRRWNRPTLHPTKSRRLSGLMTEEPHRSRHMEILRAHRSYIAPSRYATPTHCFRALLFCAMPSGARQPQPLLAINEITHNLAFTRIVPEQIARHVCKYANRSSILGHIQGLPLGTPQVHGQDGIDVDLPTQLELVLLNNVLGKVFFRKSLELSAHPSTFQILFYALRPGLVRSQRLGRWHTLNIVIQLVFNYLLVSTARLAAIHYLWDGLEQETYSYYGPLNVLAYNVGYHNEHHDFPSIPWTRLPALRALAPKAYDSLPAHPSWPMVIVNFIRDKEVGIFARAKRLSRSQRVRRVRQRRRSMRTRR
ncbi:dihydroceramide delta(4)-desaturase [Mycena olivaceomarginata]|nr:dihydroceramide delta(4)-desaturase [Mycena olivaceomarginata]